VLAAEWGHGRPYRQTFPKLQPGRIGFLLPANTSGGKNFKGLTDALLMAQTGSFWLARRTASWTVYIGRSSFVEIAFSDWAGEHAIGRSRAASSCAREAIQGR